jgi:hypothetical protein
MQSKQRVTISRGNRKLGAIMNISTEPERYCPKDISASYDGSHAEDEEKQRDDGRAEEVSLTAFRIPNSSSGGGPVHGNGMQGWNMGGNVVWICLFGVVLIIALALIFRTRR